jgi:hypothetical protein
MAGGVGGRKKCLQKPKPSVILLLNPHTPQDFPGWSFHYSQVLLPTDLVTLPSTQIFVPFFFFFFFSLLYIIFVLPF